MFDAVGAAAFENIGEPSNITVDLGERILEGVPDTPLERPGESRAETFPVQTR
jgi:hypothetical protein